jgi:hypothetical protein
MRPTFDMRADHTGEFQETEVTLLDRPRMSAIRNSLISPKPKKKRKEAA